MLKVAVIGGGSTYTPELLMGFLERQKVFPLDELWLMDIDQERLSIVGGFSKKLAQLKNARFKVILSNNLDDSIQDASYVITQFRVGKMAARRNDEYLGKRNGLIGQETTGIGGMAKALRTVPEILKVASKIQALAQNALLVNFTNPSGLITEALYRHAPGVSAVGVCNSAVTTKNEILENLNKEYGLNIQPDNANIKTLGLNHLTWFYGLEVNGRDYWPQVMQVLIKEMKQEDDPYFDPRTLEVLQMLPNSYLSYYYYKNEALAMQNNWPPSRAEEVQKIEVELLEKYQEENRTDPPKALMKRGGAFYSTVATQLINAHYNNLNETHVVNVRNNGAVPGWNNDWVLELPCRVNMSGIVPFPAKPLPLVCESLIARVKAYEILTVEAAVNGDRLSAYQALLAHPLGPDADMIDKVLDDLLETNRQFLPDFFN